MTLPAHHTIVFGPPRDVLSADLQRGGKPAILQRSDEDFIEATLHDLRSEVGRVNLRRLLAQTAATQGRVKLFQPIQRQFHLALLEAWCDTPGWPRIDPARVASAGFVLRRKRADGRLEAWMRSKGRIDGWQLLPHALEKADPDSARRLKHGLSGVPDIDKALTVFRREAPQAQSNEHVIPLYLAPPDVCAEAHKTLFYGMVPTASSELSEAPPVFAKDNSFAPDSAMFIGHLVEALTGAGQDFPFPGAALVQGWFEASEMPGDNAPAGVSGAQWDQLKNPATRESRQMARFILLLRQLSSEFNVFDESDATVEPVRVILRGLQCPLPLRPNDSVVRFVSAYRFLQTANRVLLLQEGGSATMPTSFPRITDSRARTRLLEALHEAMRQRFLRIKGKAGRFDEPDATYVICAFVRLKADCDCPPRLVWSELSDPFVIAQWYEGAGAPPVQISLPDVTDKNLLKALKPNVSFVVPPSLQALLAGKPADLMKGKGGTGGGLQIAWICSFSIPLITICAFIVLNIFLTLFHLVFGWLFFIKICLPFPNFKK